MTNIWNQRYQSDEFFYGEEPNDFLKDVSKKLKPNSQILCLAEGEGRNAVYLATLGHQVTAVDMSDVGLEKLKTLAMIKNTHVETIVADLAEYNIGENKWDAIVSIWCHLPSALRVKVHADCVKGLKAEGIFILEAYTPEQLNFRTGGPNNLDMLMTEAALRAELKGLNFLQLTETKREIHEGEGHNGPSAVVQAFGVKH